MGYLAGVLIAAGFFLIWMAFWTRGIKDFQLGPVSMWARGEEVRKQEERNIRQQNAQAAFFLKLLRLGVALVVAGIVLLIVGTV
jgi:hypothetical protein